MLIGGKFVDGAEAPIDVVNPATEEIIDAVPSASRDQVNAAAAAARAAFRDWRRTPAPERAELLHRLAGWISDNTDSLAVTLTREGGKPLVENKDEMGWTA